MQLERGEGKGRGTTDIQRVLAELEFVKQQNWEEKRKLSQKFESNRFVCPPSSFFPFMSQRTYLITFFRILSLLSVYICCH